MDKALDNIKKHIAGGKKFFKRIVNMVRFIATPLGHVIGMLVLICVIVLILAVVLKTISTAFAKWFDPNYAGLSTDEDYEVLVSSVGYAGYDSVISEKDWQEYLAYEYSVLMDVADYLYEGQKKFDEDPENNCIDYSEKKEDKKTTAKAQKHLPYLLVEHEYDLREIKHEFWQAAVIEGQNSARTGFTNPADVGAEGTNYTSYGGQTECVPPIFTFEFRNNPYDENAGSLVPYVSIVKEGLKYHYFTVGGEGENGGRPNYEEGGKYSHNDHNTGVAISWENINDVNYLEKNNELNINNEFLRNSTTMAKQILKDQGTGNLDASAVTGEGKWITADVERPQMLYFTDDYSSTIYKFPLQILVDRYLPKASLMTSWYLLKDTEYKSGDEEIDESAYVDQDSKFNVDQLMKDMKQIYNKYCWEKETLATETVSMVTYDINGVVVRSGDDNKAIKVSGDRYYSTTNESTFINFGQVGLETNRYGVLSLYTVGKVSGPSCPADFTKNGEEDQATIPIVTDLLADDAWFLETASLHVTYDYDFEYLYDKVVYSKTETKEDAGKVTLTDSEMSHLKSLANDQRFTPKHAKADNCDICNGSKLSPYRTGIARRIKSKESHGSSNTTTFYLYKLSTSESASEPQEEKDETTGMHGSIDIVYHKGDDLDALYKQVSDLIRELAIKEAEKKMLEEQDILEAEGYHQESAEHSFANYFWEYPSITSTASNGTVSAKPLESEQINVKYYDQSIPFYYFVLLGKSDANIEKLQKTFTAKILECAQEYLPQSSEFIEALKSLITEKGPEPLPTAADMPLPPDDTSFDSNDEKRTYSNPRFSKITNIYNMNIEGWTTPDGEPYYKQVSTYSPEPTNSADGTYQVCQNAVYSFREETIALTIDIPQKRCSAMLATSGETWSKSLEYTNKIEQNEFFPFNYRYVIPHNHFGFGLTNLNITEHADFRIDYYKEYFSDPENESENPNLIKESDVMSMFLKWEEYAEKGVDTAYVFIRDVYKLVNFMKSEGVIHNQAYSYMYIPEDIWDFREGITQESYWTQLLAADLWGADSLEQDELETMRVKKDVIKWQQLDYKDYEECQYDEGSGMEGTAKVYALFPHGNELARSFYMETAIRTGKFIDGGFKDGHAGADWYSRRYMSEMYSESSGVEKEKEAQADIYNSELKRLTIKNIMESPYVSDKKEADYQSFITQFGTNDEAYANLSAYTSAKSELDQKIKTYMVKSPIVSIATGLCVKSYYNCYGGFAVHIVHLDSDTNSGNGKIYSTYAHMRRWPSVQVGDVVGPGTIVGYEGTTGRSSGYHLHMGINYYGEHHSPSRYMAPIFAPFYNSEKIGELLKQSYYKEDNRRLLGTDYLSLIRTVLLPTFDGTKLNQVLSNSDEGVYLSSATFVRINDDDSQEIVDSSDTNLENLYIVYDDVDDSVYIESSNGTVIVKEGKNNPVYWKCQVEKVEIEMEERVSADDSPTGEEYSTGRIIVKRRLKVLSRTQIELAKEVSLGQITINSSVSTDNIVNTAVPVKWGNNVPYLPLIEDYKKGYDIAQLTIAKPFTQREEDTPNGTFDKSSDIEDVRAFSGYFDADSATVKEHSKVSGSLLMQLSDIINPNAVPFYDGPIAVSHGGPGGYDYYTSNPSPTIAGGNYGYAGTISGDLQKLQKALKSYGFAPDDMNTDGEFNDKTIEAIQTAAAALTSAGFKKYVSSASSGQLGTFSGQHYDNRYLDAWNAYVTYGTLDNALSAGRSAIAYASAATGLDYKFLIAVSENEGGLLATRESDEFADGLNNASFATAESLSAAVDGDGILLDLSDGNYSNSRGKTVGYDIIEYPDGQPRVVRRAQGMFQLMWSVAKGRLKSKGITEIEDIASCIRSPITNAILASEYLSDNQIRVYNNNESLSVANPYSEIQSFIKSGSAGAKAWIEAANWNHTTPETLFVYAMSAIMYNKGPNADSSYFDALKQVEWNPLTHQLKYVGGGSKPGYGIDCVNAMIK